MKILLAYATGIALLVLGVFWLRRTFPAGIESKPPPASTAPSTPPAR